MIDLVIIVVVFSCVGQDGVRRLHKRRIVVDSECRKLGISKILGHDRYVADMMSMHATDVRPYDIPGDCQRCVSGHITCTTNYRER